MRDELDVSAENVDPPPEDAIVAEVRATREALAAAAGYDFQRMYAALKAIEAAEREQGRVIVSPPARPGSPEAAA